MKRILGSFLLVSLLFSFSFSQSFTRDLDGKKMLERAKRLSADDFEGRGPGTAGGQRAAEYIADQLRSAGVKPANRGSYFQNVKLVGVKADPKTVLEISGSKGSESFRFGDDFVAFTGAQSEKVVVDAELVFAGYGIDAPLYNWNDYSGKPDDYRGKLLMIMVNDPPATAAEPNLFGGKALTYYGRWTYKFEEAARRGAAGVILIHTDESAGYGWNVVRTSNGSWRFDIARTKGDATPFLKLKSWVTNETASKILRHAGQNLDDLRERAKIRGFKPVNTGLRVKMDLRSQMQTLDSPNIVGMIEGSDPKLKNEYIVYTAHWDHLGIADSIAAGDRIYNGALDNASGVAAVIGIGEAVAKLPQARRPKRSLLFLFPTAEEQGLLGAEYYAKNPLVPLSKTAANINLDGVNFFGLASDFSALGQERSTIGPVAAEIARERNLTLTGDAHPEQGYFFRSDHFPFARAGVPAISVRRGEAFITPLKGEAAAFFRDYNSKHYHQVSDEYHDWWDASAMVQAAEIALAIGIKLADAPQMPSYMETDEFSGADKRRMTR